MSSQRPLNYPHRQTCLLEPPDDRSCIRMVDVKRVDRTIWDIPLGRSNPRPPSDPRSDFLQDRHGSNLAEPQADVSVDFAYAPRLGDGELWHEDVIDRRREQDPVEHLVAEGKVLRDALDELEATIARATKRVDSHELADQTACVRGHSLNATSDVQYESLQIGELGKKARVTALANA